MELKMASGHKVAKYGTTTNFYDGTTSEVVKLKVQAAGVTAYGDDANTYTTVTSTGLNVIEDSVNVANFGETMRIGVDATDKSALRVASNGTLTIGTSNTTAVSLTSAGNLTVTGAITASSGSIADGVTVGSGDVAASTVVTGAVAGSTANQDTTATIRNGVVTHSINQSPHFIWSAFGDAANISGPAQNSRWTISWYNGSGQSLGTTVIQAQYVTSGTSMTVSNHTEVSNASNLLSSTAAVVTLPTGNAAQVKLTTVVKGGVTIILTSQAINGIEWDFPKE